MAGLGRRFDATAQDTTPRAFENVPEGDYKMEVESSESKPTNDGTGKYLKFAYRILAPDAYENRKIFGNINIENKNAEAQRIGLQELASLCRACGKSEIDDSEELHFISFMAKVGLSKAQTKGGKTYEPRNEIKRFYYPDEGALPAAKAAAKPANDNQPVPAAANDNATQPQQQAAVAGAKRRPWGR